jgi:metal-responsive CopG/Arc/MetJ family transcriptional regulator
MRKKYRLRPYNNKKFLCILPEKLLEEVDYYADNLFMSRLAFIRSALIFYIEHLKQQEKNKGERKHGVVDIWE